MMVVYISEKHLFCTLRKEKEKKKIEPFMGNSGRLIFFYLERQK